MLYLLDENLFNGRRCTIIFHNPELFNKLKSSQISGMNSLINKLEKANGQPFPTNIDFIHLKDNFCRVKQGDARIILYIIAEIQTAITVWACKRDEHTYDKINSAKGRTELYTKAIQAFNNYTQQREQNKDNDSDLLDVEAADVDYVLILKFKNGDYGYCDFNPLIYRENNNRFIDLQDSPNEFKRVELEGSKIIWPNININGNRYKHPYITLEELKKRRLIMTPQEYKKCCEYWRHRRYHYRLY